MKRIILFVLILTASANIGNAQDSLQSKQLQQLLSAYYQISEALVSGNSSNAASYALEFVKVANTIDYKLISEGNINALLKDASPITELTNLNRQRSHFANLSNNMTILVRSLKFTSEPIYQVYCPMKKASWLTKEQSIRNPYYGSAMLTCGEIKETISTSTQHH